MYKCIDYLLYSSHKIQKLTYKIVNKSKIKIFGEQFIGNNENKCAIIYKDKIIPLQSFFLFKDINREDKENQKLEILLIELEDISDRSYMFHNCFSLVEFVEFSNFEINNNEIKTKLIEEERYFQSIDTNKYNNFYQNDIDFHAIKKNISNSTEESFIYLVSEYNKIYKAKRSRYAFLKNISYMFSGCFSLTSLPDISEWSTNNVLNMCDMFSGCSSLISLPDISKWNTTNVIDMSSMFNGCLLLKSLPNITKWDTNNVKRMSCVFFRCSSLKSLPDISKWNTDNLNDMSSMF